MDPYKVLGISEKDSWPAVNRAYQKKIKDFNPEQCSTEKAKKVFINKTKEINEAYLIIEKIFTENIFEQITQDLEKRAEENNSKPKELQDEFLEEWYEEEYDEDFLYKCWENNDKKMLREIRNIVFNKEYVPGNIIKLLKTIRVRDAEWYFLCGVIECETFLFETGLDKINTAINTEPENEEYKRIYEYLSEKSEMYKPDYENLEKEDKELIYNIRMMLYTDPLDIEKISNELKKVKNRNSEWRFLYGLILAKQGLYRDAEINIKKAANQNPQNEGYKEKLKEIRKKIPDYTNLKPESKRKLIEARNMIHKGSYIPGRVKAILESVPEKNAEWYFLYGEALCGEYLYELGFDYLTTAINLDPDNESYEQNLEYYEKMSEKYSPDYSNITIDEKNTLIKVRDMIYTDYHDCFKGIRMLESVNTKNAEWHYLYGVLKINSRHYDAGIKNIETAMGLAPENLNYKEYYDKVKK